MYGRGYTDEIETKLIGVFFIKMTSKNRQVRTFGGFLLRFSSFLFNVSKGSTFNLFDTLRQKIVSFCIFKNLYSFEPCAGFRLGPFPVLFKINKFNRQSSICSVPVHTGISGSTMKLYRGSDLVSTRALITANLRSSQTALLLSSLRGPHSFHVLFIVTPESSEKW